MRKTIYSIPFVLAALAWTPTFLSAQSDEADVQAAVESLFDAMRAADGTAAGSLFRSDARLQSVSVQDGRTVVATGDVAAFVRAIGTPRTQRWDERVWDLEVRVDGDLATAWMNYAFYVDDQFSHCGVNAFQLVRTEDRWRILQITDTRRTSGCEAPA